MHLFVTSNKNYFPIIDLLISPWGEALRDKIIVTTYHFFFEHLQQKNFNNLNLIFCDLDIVSSSLKSKLIESLPNAEQLFQRKIHIQNHPRYLLNRLDLLKKLFQSGLNNYNVYTYKEIDSIKQFPVFLKNKSNHSGPLSPLLYSYKNLQEELTKHSQKSSIIIVEFQNHDRFHNYYKKYSYFIFNNVLLPRHLIFSSDWFVKRNKSSSSLCAHQEHRFINAIDHKNQIEPIIQLSGISYGRIDYGLYQGKVQTWEINTNPLSLEPLDAQDHLRIHNHHLFAQRYIPLLSDTDNLTTKQKQLFKNEMFFLKTHIKEGQYKKMFQWSPLKPLYKNWNRSKYKKNCIHKNLK